MRVGLSDLRLDRLRYARLTFAMARKGPVAEISALVAVRSSYPSWSFPSEDELAELRQGDGVKVILAASVARARERVWCGIRNWHDDGKSINVTLESDIVNEDVAREVQKAGIANGAPFLINPKQHIIDFRFSQAHWDESVALQVMRKPLENGAMVKLHSLQSRTHNGLSGRVGDYDAEKGRWKVILSATGQELGVKPENLRQIPQRSSLPTTWSGLSGDDQAELPGFSSCSNDSPRSVTRFELFVSVPFSLTAWSRETTWVSRLVGPGCERKFDSRQ